MNEKKYPWCSNKEEKRKEREKREEEKGIEELGRSLERGRGEFERETEILLTNCKSEK